MQITSIQEIASSSTQWPPTHPQPKSAFASSGAADIQPEPAVPVRASEPARLDLSSAPVDNAASSALGSMIAASYSTTVGGKSYSGSVSKTGETYTASVPIPPGVSASGSSIESAEMNLNIILDTLA